MIRFPFTVILTYIFWLLLTFSFTKENLVIGLFVAFVASFIANRFLFSEVHGKPFNPLRWFRFTVYFFVWIYAEVISHIDVICRIFTGRINPAIVKIPTKMKSDFGKTFLANSITLTPGSLTMKTDSNSLYVHVINYKKTPGKLFERFGVGVTE
ncbi:MAG: Na+/H+ antiporter subunit E [Nanoarchaeota archaeon]